MRPGFVAARGGLRLAATLTAWAWSLAAGGGGFWLMATQGPMRLTHGWFALASGLAACPATAWLVRRHMHVSLGGWTRFAAAAGFFVAGRIALGAGL